MKIIINRRRRCFAYTLAELAFVGAILSAVPVGTYTQVTSKAHEKSCVNNLVNIGRALHLHLLTSDAYPQAAFYPKNPIRGKDSIRVILGGSSQLWVCPGLPKKLQNRGLTFVYNNDLSGQPEVQNPAKTWVLIEMNCVSKSAPTAHPGGFNVLFADGHVITTKVLPPGIRDDQRAMLEKLMEHHEHCDSEVVAHVGEPSSGSTTPPVES